MRQYLGLYAVCFGEGGPLAAIRPRKRAQMITAAEQDSPPDASLRLEHYAALVPLLAEWGLVVSDPVQAFATLDPSSTGTVAFDSVCRWAQSVQLQGLALPAGGNPTPPAPMPTNGSASSSGGTAQYSSAGVLLMSEASRLSVASELAAGLAVAQTDGEQMKEAIINLTRHNRRQALEIGRLVGMLEARGGTDAALVKSPYLTERRGVGGGAGGKLSVGASRRAAKLGARTSAPPPPPPPFASQNALNRAKTAGMPLSSEQLDVWAEQRLISLSASAVPLTASAPLGTSAPRSASCAPREVDTLGMRAVEQARRDHERDVLSAQAETDESAHDAEAEMEAAAAMEEERAVVGMERAHVEAERVRVERATAELSAREAAIAQREDALMAHAVALDQTSDGVESARRERQALEADCIARVTATKEALAAAEARVQTSVCQADARAAEVASLQRAQATLQATHEEEMKVLRAQVEEAVKAKERAIRKASRAACATPSAMPSAPPTPAADAEEVGEMRAQIAALTAQLAERSSVSGEAEVAHSQLRKAKVSAARLQADKSELETKLRVAKSVAMSHTQKIAAQLEAAERLAEERWDEVQGMRAKLRAAEQTVAAQIDVAASDALLLHAAPLADGGMSGVHAVNVGMMPAEIANHVASSVASKVAAAAQEAAAAVVSAAGLAAAESAAEQVQEEQRELILENQQLRGSLDAATGVTSTLTKKVEELTRMLEAHTDDEQHGLEARLEESAAKVGEASRQVYYSALSAGYMPGSPALLPELPLPSTPLRSTPAVFAEDAEEATWQQVLEKRRAVALAKQELASLSDDERGSVAVGYATAASREANATSPDFTGLSAAEAHGAGMALRATHHGAVLKAVRDEAVELEQRVGAVLPLPQPLTLVVHVDHLVADAALARTVPDALACIALGATRQVGSPATFEHVVSGAVETLDVELWDAEATHMIGHATLSIGRVLSGETSRVHHDVLVGLVGREPVGSVRVAVEAHAV